MRFEQPSYGARPAETAQSSGRLWAARGLAVLAMLLVAAADALVAMSTAFDPILFCLWFIVPAGAIAVGGIVAAAFVAACRGLGVRAQATDLPLLMVVLLALPLAVLATDYVMPVLRGGHALHELRPFGDYLADSVTHATLTVHSREWGTASGPVGEFGWFQLIPRLAALMALAKIAHASAAAAPRRQVA